MASHRDRRSNLGAYQLRGLWGFQVFFYLLLHQYLTGFKSHSTEKLQQIFTLLSVVVAPERLSLKCEACCAEALFIRLNLRQILPQEHPIQADKEVAER